MVRFISILKKGLKKPSSRGASKEVALPPENSGMLEENPALAVAPEMPFRRKTVTNPKSLLASPSGISDEECREMYNELYAAAQASLGQGLDRERITQALHRAVGIFERALYNPLLLMGYSFSKKSYLPAHIVNDVLLTIGFARSLGYDHAATRDIALCAFVHDLGMSSFEGISKKGQQLAQHEIEDVKQHPLRSAELVRPVFGEKVAAVVLDVHERANGQGYPKGVPGSGIHLWAKIISVCDTFEALTHPRIFRPQYSPYEAMKIIIKKKDILFDDVIVRRFIDFLSIYPVGSLVYLNSGEMALVTGSNPGSPTRPMVRILVNENLEIDDSGALIDLSAKDFVYISGVVEMEKEKEVLYFLKPRGQVDVDEA
ncbi:MAG: HD domain-containing protein [Candidatus Omnitrophica bacterium]|nr:HD domain-containing protein [Candidatus Omnitrophota bacterium]